MPGHEFLGKQESSQKSQVSSTAKRNRAARSQGLHAFRPRVSFVLLITGKTTKPTLWATLLFFELFQEGSVKATHLAALSQPQLELCQL